MAQFSLSLPPHRPWRSLAWFVVKGCLLAILVIYTLGPLVWLFMTSLKTREQILASKPVFFFTPDWSAYEKFLSLHDPTVLTRMGNSVVISLSTVLATLALSSLAAYGFSRYRFPARRSLLLLMLATRLLPPVTAIIPLFLLFNQWRLIDTREGLVLVYTALSIPLATWMMKAFFDSVPVELEEAALIDGASRMRALLHVTMPLAAPGMAATSIFTFITAWNDFTFAFIFTSTNARTLPVLLSETIGEMQIYWQDLATLAILLSVPTLLFSVVAQKNLVEGLTTGALK